MDKARATNGAVADGVGLGLPTTLELVWQPASDRTDRRVDDLRGPAAVSRGI